MFYNQGHLGTDILTSMKSLKQLVFHNCLVRQSLSRERPLKGLDIQIGIYDRRKGEERPILARSTPPRGGGRQRQVGLKHEL